MESFRLDVESQVNLKDAVIKYHHHFTLEEELFKQAIYDEYRSAFEKTQGLYYSF